MILISTNGIGGNEGDGERGDSTAFNVGISLGAATAALVAAMPPTVGSFVEAAIKFNQENTRARMLAAVNFDQENTQTLMSGALTDSFSEIEPPDESQEYVGFVCVHQGNDTWLPRGLYEGRQRAWRQEARRPHYHPWPGRRPVKRVARLPAKRQSRR